MYKGFEGDGWSIETSGRGTVETKYIIEYINDAKTWDKMIHNEDRYKEPWEFYSKKEFDNIAEALSFYMIWFVSEDCFEIKMWEQIYVNNEMVLEQLVEPKPITKYYMRKSINEEMNNRMIQAEKRKNLLKESNDLYKGFIEHMGNKFEKMFDDYVKQIANNNRRIKL